MGWGVGGGGGGVIFIINIHVYIYNTKMKMSKTKKIRLTIIQSEKIMKTCDTPTDLVWSIVICIITFRKPGVGLVVPC